MAQQPPPGQYPPPPGQPGQPVPPPGQPGAYPPPPPQPGFGAKAGGAAKAVGVSIVVRIVIGIVIIGVLAIGGWIVKNLTGDPDIAKTGDCVTDAVSAEDMKVVDCSDPTAAFKVVKKVDDVVDKGSDQDTIDYNCGIEDESWTQGLYSSDKRGNIDYILCLGPTS